MKLAIITDQHFGARKGADYIHRYFKKFYDNTFFPYLEKNKIDTIVDMGDTFDNRRTIDLWAIDWARNNYYDILHDMGIQIHTVVGNHTAYYKDTNEINTIDLLLKQYDNITTYAETEEIKLGDLSVLLIPWINSENEETSFDVIKSSKSKVAMGHLELNGFRAHRGHVMEDGMDIDIFDKFDKVYSGHFHMRSNKENIFYLGNPYEMYWNDVNDRNRGFHLFDTDTLEHTPVNNPYQLFHNLYYEDTPHQMLDITKYDQKILKVIVRKKSDPKQFEKYIDKLYSSNLAELKIVENFDFTEGEEFEADESEDTISLLNRYIQESEVDLDKSVITEILQDVYREACEVE